MTYSCLTAQCVASGNYDVDIYVVNDAQGGMNDAYENALRTVADSYDAEVARWGGKSLSRVATIVVSSGAFFNRLRDGRTFSVTNLEKFASWFRVPANWPDRSIPHEAALALTSMGRPPLPHSVPHPMPHRTGMVDYDRADVSQQVAK